MRNILAILLSGIWIAASEFIRNELLFKHYWTDHYESMGLVFPSRPVNGLIWVVWSMVCAIILFVLLKKFRFWSTVLIGWVSFFVLMWLVVGNMAVLPVGILFFAIPLSILEVLLASFILLKLRKV